MARGLAWFLTALAFAGVGVTLGAIVSPESHSREFPITGALRVASGDPVQERTWHVDIRGLPIEQGTPVKLGYAQNFTFLRAETPGGVEYRTEVHVDDVRLGFLDYGMTSRMGSGSYERTLSTWDATYDPREAVRVTLVTATYPGEQGPWAAEVDPMSLTVTWEKGRYEWPAVVSLVLLLGAAWAWRRARPI